MAKDGVIKAWKPVVGSSNSLYQLTKGRRIEVVKKSLKVFNVSAVVFSAQQRSSQMSKKKAAGNQVGQVPSPSLLQGERVCYLETTRWTSAGLDAALL